MATSLYKLTPDTERDVRNREQSGGVEYREEEMDGENRRGEKRNVYGGEDSRGEEELS